MDGLQQSFLIYKWINNHTFKKLDHDNQPFVNWIQKTDESVIDKIKTKHTVWIQKTTEWLINI